MPRQQAAEAVYSRAGEDDVPAALSFDWRSDADDAASAVVDKIEYSFNLG